MICAEELNRRVTIQSKSGSQDSYGQPGETWSDIVTVSASIITTGGREFYAAQKLNAEISAVIKIRYRTGLDVKMRVKYGERYFSILSIADPEERHEELLLSCKEVV
jgi:SPP1 family predicted phage head-tail adaptor